MTKIAICRGHNVMKDDLSTRVILPFNPSNTVLYDLVVIFC